MPHKKYFTEEERKAAAAKSAKQWRENNLERWNAIQESSRQKHLEARLAYGRRYGREHYVPKCNPLAIPPLNDKELREIWERIRKLHADPNVKTDSYDKIGFDYGRTSRTIHRVANQQGPYKKRVQALIDEGLDLVKAPCQIYYASLNAKQVVQIWTRLRLMRVHNPTGKCRGGDTQAKISKDFNVTKKTINRISTGESWSCVTDTLPPLRGVRIKADKAVEDTNETNRRVHGTLSDLLAVSQTGTNP